MLYQIYYDDKIMNATMAPGQSIQPFGVHEAKSLPRQAHCLYDDERLPNLTEHNTLCEWRVLYYIWRHYPTQWVGFTSWQHDRKGFSPIIGNITTQWIQSAIKCNPISGFIVRPLYSVMIQTPDERDKLSLRQQFLQWSMIEHIIGKKIYDTRGMPLSRYHTAPYWDFVMNAYRDLYGVNLEKDLDWNSLAGVDDLHVWCNAFVAHWDYFNAYMKMFSPIALGLLEYFGSHPVDLELSYICERLIIIYNYIRYANNDFS